MKRPRVHADFHNADSQGRLRLNCIGTVEDLSRQGVTLVEGLRLALYSEDMETEGEVLYSSEEGLWVAAVDWDAIREVDGESASHEGHSWKRFAGMFENEPLFDEVLEEIEAHWRETSGHSRRPKG